MPQGYGPAGPSTRQRADAAADAAAEAAAAGIRPRHFVPSTPFQRA
ncbi:hypothetical protein [Microterricola pindariensis]|nr:hypothetical protein [Microterricola pindariensis]